MIVVLVASMLRLLVAFHLVMVPLVRPLVVVLVVTALPVM